MMEDRNITKTDIEYILLNREYSELTSDEKTIVEEHVSSEQEFLEMKGMLMGTTRFFHEEEDLVPNPAIKTALMKEFEKQRPAGTYWLNGMFVSLFPKEKKFLQKPGVQLLGLAASVLLVITVFFNTQGEMNKSELAVVEKDLIEGVKGVKDKTIIENDFKNDLPLEETAVLEKELEKDEVSIANDGSAVTGVTTIVDQEYRVVMEDEEIITESLADTDNRLDNSSFGYANADKESLSRNENNQLDAISDETLVISAATVPTIMATESISEDDYVGGELNEEEEIDIPVNSRSLSEDAALIDILYTAM